MARTRVGILTGGGDVPGLNSVIKSVVCGDALNALAYRIRPYEVEPGATNRAVERAKKILYKALYENTNLLKRRYKGLTAQGTYRFSPRTDIGATYTLPRTFGNFNGENVVSGPITALLLSYPEYAQESWNYPEGDLQVDQRHRARLWLNVGVPAVKNLTVSLLQTLETGVPFGPTGTVPVTGNVGLQYVHSQQTGLGLR